MNIRYRQYGLLANMFVLVSALLISKDMFAKETMDSASMMVTIFFMGLLYYMYKKLGDKVAQMAVRFILDIYPGYMMKYQNKNKMTNKLHKDLEMLNSTDSLFVLMRYNLYVVASIFVFNAMGAVFDNYSQVFAYFLVVDILLLMIVIAWSWYGSFKVFQQYKNSL